jgi:hypothetical protein
MKFPVQMPAVVRDRRFGPAPGVEPAVANCLCSAGDCPGGKKNLAKCMPEGTCICCPDDKPRPKRGPGGACDCQP